MEHDKKRAISTVLLVDDDRPTLNIWRRELRDRKTLVACTRQEAAMIAKAEHIDVAIVDLRLDRENGLDVLGDLKSIDPSVFVALVSAEMTVAETMNAVRAGADYVFAKPLRCERFINRLEAGAPVDDDGPTGNFTLDQIARERIDRALVDCDNNITHAARELGMHRTTLQRKLKKRGWRAPRQPR